MILITGDTHGQTIRRMNDTEFVDGKIRRVVDKLQTKADFLIVCGDFGEIWDFDGPSVREIQDLEYINSLPFTTLFVDGNHENFDRLNAYPVEEWNGGKVHKIMDSIIHLMRGQVYNIPNGNETVSIFTFGGARSHDIQDGVLDPLKDAEKIRTWSKQNYIASLMPLAGYDYKFFRVIGQTWWEQEMPTTEEFEEGMANLDKVGWKVDYIITHDCGNDLRRDYFGFGKASDCDDLTSYLNMIRKNCEYKQWYFGHIHKDEWLTEKDCILYHRIIPLGVPYVGRVPKIETVTEEDNSE